MSKQKTDRREFLIAVGSGMFALSLLAATGSSAFAAQAAQAAVAPDMSKGADNFYTSAQVTVEMVRFSNQYQMSVAGNLYKIGRASCRERV